VYRGWLERRSAFAPPPVRRQSILLACAPSDLHTIGSPGHGDALREDCWASCVLGARTPTLMLAAARPRPPRWSRLPGARAGLLRWQRIDGDPQ